MGGRQKQRARIKVAREAGVSDAALAVRAQNAAAAECVYFWLADAGQLLGNEQHDGHYHARVQVSASGEVRVWDSVARHYSASLARELTAEQRAEIAGVAAKAWSLSPEARDARYSEDAMFVG